MMTKVVKALKVQLFFIWDTKYHRNRLICFLLKTPSKNISSRPVNRIEPLYV